MLKSSREIQRTLYAKDFNREIELTTFATESEREGQRREVNFYGSRLDKK